MPRTTRERLRPVVFLALAFLLIDSAGAQEWTRFRGPNGAGRSETVLPAAFEGNQINWVTKLPGIGHSSPVIWGDKVFLLSADPKTATRYVVCVDTKGKIQWTKEYTSESHPIHVRSSFASCTPVVDESRVYVAWSTPKQTTLVALSHDGTEAWQRDLGTWTSQHGFGTSPIRYKDMLIMFVSQQAERLKPDEVAGESSMLALDAATGETRWQTPRKSIRVCYSVPFVHQGKDGRDELISCSTAEGIFAVDAETGKPRWNYADAFSMRTVGSPIEAGGLIFGSTGSGGGGNYVVALKPGPEPEVAYQIKRNAPYVPTLVADNSGLAYLWFDKGIVTCIDVKTGEEHWRERVSSAFSGSPVIAGDKVYCMDEDGVLIALAASKEYKLLGKTDLKEPTRSTPAIAGGRMYARTESQLYSLGGPSS
ncbi:MAG: PQQ-binding-like beta-propeller repeat protein [Planctomycetales bacterium]|nr:PQQ-binding-like beta-propeller repeat protein [Planctomycetales bacterium]